VTPIRELPVRFSAGRDTLLGVLSHPASGGSRTGILIAPGGWYGTSTARNRLLVRMARTFAADGYGAFCFDYNGVGDSTGTTPRFLMKDPFTDDVNAAAGVLTAHGYKDLVLVGVCYGGRIAIALAPGMTNIKGLALVSVPLGKPGDGGGKTAQAAARTSTVTLARKALNPIVIRGLFDHNLRHSYARVLGAKWRSSKRRVIPQRIVHDTTPKDDALLNPVVSDSLSAVLEREVPLLFVYGEEDGYYKAFMAARAGKLGALLAAARGHVDLVMLPGQIQSFATVDAQEASITAVRTWVRDVVGGTTEQASVQVGSK
jgi:pimeloyl-ACP methyl ester carboxylesterase